MSTELIDGQPRGRTSAECACSTFAKGGTVLVSVVVPRCDAIGPAAAAGARMPGGVQRVRYRGWRGVLVGPGWVVVRTVTARVIDLGGVVLVAVLVRVVLLVWFAEIILLLLLILLCSDRSVFADLHIRWSILFIRDGR